MRPHFRGGLGSGVARLARDFPFEDEDRFFAGERVPELLLVGAVGDFLVGFRAMKKGYHA